MNAITVSVDYTDLLSITMPYNRHHFNDFMIVTAHKNYAELLPIANKYDCKLFVTDIFYEREAIFNKWAALELGLDHLGRNGWLCIMDADVLWPKGLRIEHPGDCLLITNPVEYMQPTAGIMLTPGMLCTPLRRMFGSAEMSITQYTGIPQEENWPRFPIHRNVNEWAGYSQIFHASDSVLGTPPWHEIDWCHAGGADSFFQAKWLKERKVRPPWECLHLGDAGKNWMGRATPYLNGTIPCDSAEKLDQVKKIWDKRRDLRREGKDQFTDERIR